MGSLSDCRQRASSSQLTFSWPIHKKPLMGNYVWAAAHNGQVIAIEACWLSPG